MVSVLVSSFDFIFTILSQLKPFQIVDQFLILCICSLIFTISIYEITYNLNLITGKTNSIPCIAWLNGGNCVIVLVLETIIYLKTQVEIPFV